MNDAASKTRVLLLVEDNPADAQLVGELLSDADRENYQIIHVTRLADATSKLQSLDIDVVVLDLRLPDCAGVQGVMTVRQVAEQTPIVVLTGTEDEQLALACIDAGAQDYLAKNEIRSQNLRRAIGYAITRVRESQLRQMEEALQRYRALSSLNQGTLATAALAGSGAIAVRSPEAFREITQLYFLLFDPFLHRLADRVEAARSDMEAIVTRLGDYNGGPRDLLDVHLAALEMAARGSDSTHARSIVFEARLLALEMMGLLVDYYRVGQRRRFREGAVT